MNNLVFPASFLWGAASSAFQIEGTVAGDGRGRSIWDDFCATPGNIQDGSNGERACDHLRLWASDIALLKTLGVSAYRFSVAWPRIFPDGSGRPNQTGIDFYKKLVDGLLAAGLEPWLTLYHWDLPSALEAMGGWRHRATAEAFAAYAELMAQELGDRVSHWITHNEPWCVAVLGHRTGEHAPGLRSANAALKTAHHVLLSHGLAAARIRAVCPAAQVGITLNLTPSVPADPSSPGDQEATRIYDGDFNRWYLDAVMCGRYPQDMIKYYEASGALAADGWSFVQSGDLAIIKHPLDFLGVNFYTRAVMSEQGQVLADANASPRDYTAMGWEVAPTALTDLFQRLQREYPAKAYYITENGAAYADHVSDDGSIDDPLREAYFARHLAEVAKICALGIPLRGYFAWSIIDNFEWAHGYQKRFGLAYVDYATLRRTPKRSFNWLKDTIAEHHRASHSAT